MSKVLIVGGGHAGANTAFALRKDGFDGEITIIRDESYLPYHRPPLSKDFLKQNVAIEKLSFKSSDFYKEQNISLNLNTRSLSLPKEIEAILGLGPSSFSSSACHPIESLPSL